MKKVNYPDLAGEMARNGDTRKSLGKILGITYSSISRRLEGRTDWTISEIEKICKYYNKDYSQLFKRGK